MADRALYLVVNEQGELEHYYARFGAVGLDLDLMAGTDTFLAFARAYEPTTWWLDAVLAEGAVLADLQERVLLAFCLEGVVVDPTSREAAFELIRAAWPGWEVRWAYAGLDDVRRHLGLEPEVLDEDPGEPWLEIEEEDFGDPTMLGVITVGTRECRLIVDMEHHPVAYGPFLLELLDLLPEVGRHRGGAESGLHIDPETRTVGWWLLDAEPGAAAMAERWPGWTVEFWYGDWEKQATASGGRFRPPPTDRVRALATVRDAAVEHWTERAEWIRTGSATHTDDTDRRQRAERCETAVEAVRAAWRNTDEPSAPGG